MDNQYKKGLDREKINLEQPYEIAYCKRWIKKEVSKYKKNYSDEDIEYMMGHYINCRRDKKIGDSRKEFESFIIDIYLKKK